LEQVALGLKVAPIPITWRHIYHARPLLNRYSREEARRRLGWQDDVLYVLAVGRIAPVKQFPMLIEACARLEKQDDVQLVILGEGEHGNLLALGVQLGLAKNILFATTNDVGLYLYAADLYVSTSASESFGLANLEAMAAGLAVLCTAVGGVPEVVGEGAQLVKPEPKALADAMQRLLRDESLRRSIAQKGLARAEAWPDIEEIANCYEKIYQ
jgi:glycosyltransferase involved in cell wall biosynthesis